MERSGQLGLLRSAPSLFFKSFGHVFQQLPDGQMLRAHLFALAAADALGRLSMAAAGGDAVVHAGIPVVERLLGVHRGKDVGDQDVLGACAFLDAIAAAGAGNQAQTVEDAAHLAHGLHFLIVQGMKVRHGGQVVFHLFHVAHAGEHHGHIGEGRREAQRVAGVAAAVQTPQDFIRFGGQIHQAAALDGLHDDDGLAVLFADLVHLAAFHRSVLVVHIVELDLHDFDLRVLGENHIQHLGLVVEGNAEVADFAFLFQFHCRFISLAAHVFGVVVAILGMHQVKVEIVHPAPFELVFKERPDVLLLFEIGIGQLVGEQELAAIKALGHAVPDGGFALAADVAVGGIEVVEPGGDEGVRHAAKLIVIHLALLHGQAHASEAEIAVDFREKGILDHYIFLLHLYPVSDVFGPRPTLLSPFAAE